MQRCFPSGNIILNVGYFSCEDTCDSDRQISPIYQRIHNFPIIVLNNKFHNLTCATRHMPLGALDTESIPDKGTRTVYL